VAISITDPPDNSTLASCTIDLVGKYDGGAAVEIEISVGQQVLPSPIADLDAQSKTWSVTGLHICQDGVAIQANAAIQIQVCEGTNCTTITVNAPDDGCDECDH